MEQQATTDDVGDKREDKQQEEVDGTSYDPDADPRDPGSYYSFPHFAEDKQETDATQQSPGTPDEDQEATRREPGPSDQDSDLTTSDSTTQGTPIPKSTSPSSSEADQASPPFWPTSPLSKRLRSKPSPAASSPSLQRRCITSLPSSPQVSRVQPGRRVTGNTSSTVHSQHKSSPNKLYSSPAARSLRSISAAQSPSRKEQEQQQRRVSAHSQGSPQRDEEKSG